MLKRKLLNWIDRLLFSPEIKIVRLPHGRDLPLPRYMTEGSVGFDLCAAVYQPVTLEPGKTVVIPTGIAVELPVGFELQIRSRSGLAAKNGVFVLNSPGTIDWDYRGEIKVILHNAGHDPVIISRGDRVAQAVLNRVYRSKFVEVDMLNMTGRGEQGFGSTGL